MRISDWSSDVCSSDLGTDVAGPPRSLGACSGGRRIAHRLIFSGESTREKAVWRSPVPSTSRSFHGRCQARHPPLHGGRAGAGPGGGARPCPGALRSEEHTSELQSLMRISYAVFCLTKKKSKHQIQTKMQ